MLARTNSPAALATLTSPGVVGVVDLPLWADCVQGRYLLEKLRFADLWLDDSGMGNDPQLLRYRVSAGTPPSLIRDLRRLGDLYADATYASDELAWRDYARESGVYFHAADALIAKVRGEWRPHPYAVVEPLTGPVHGDPFGMVRS